MNTSPKAVRFDDDTLWVSLSDGRTIAAPLAWFPRLLEATPAQRAEVEMSRNGLHWDNKTVMAYKHVPQEVYRRFCSAPNPATYWEDRIAEEYPKGIPMTSGAAADGAKKFNDFFGSTDS